MVNLRSSTIPAQVADGRRKYVLVFNAGSSSLKFEVFEATSGLRSHSRGAVRGIGREDAAFEIQGAATDTYQAASTHRDAAELVLDAIFQGPDRQIVPERSVVATGHRIVHGGGHYSAPTIVTPAVRDGLLSLADLAPLHVPSSLDVLDTVCRRLADAPAVAVFDTAFFRELPDVARRYAVPGRWFDEYGIQRYGFHGIAHADLHDRLVRGSSEMDRPRRIVTVHLGHGCSMAAILDGRPLDTSMGHTPLEGLIMATRSGDLDPGVILHLQSLGETVGTLSDALNRESGLRGLSGVSGDVRELLALEEVGDTCAGLALEAFCYRVQKYLGAYAAVLEGIDAVVFGGGIGENVPVLRSRICRRLGWLGLELDEAANAACRGTERRISSSASAIGVHVIPVHEEEAIARDVLACMEAPDAQARCRTKAGLD